MIAHLTAPSVCVIDDEKKDYEPIQKALSAMRVACVHVKGNCKSNIPRRPFHGLKVVFTDLYLNGSVGKASASHTAKVFSCVVPENTGPLVVVIWSKHKDDTPGDDNVTEATLFKSTLLEACPVFLDKLVFLEMEKPKLPDRPAANKWVSELTRNIKAALGDASAFEAMFAWEALVRDAAIQVTNDFTALSQPKAPAVGVAPAAATKLSDNLQLALRLLVREQGGPKCSPQFAPKHLISALGQCLIDQLEHTPEPTKLAAHGTWLSDQTDLPKNSAVAPAINGFLLTSEPGDRAIQFKPGTVYQFRNTPKFKKLFGISSDDFIQSCYDGSTATFEAWKAASAATPILVELSPVCDAHHEGKRHSAILLGGLLFAASSRAKFKRSAEHLNALPTFALRWKGKGFPIQSAFLVCSSRLKVTLSHTKEPRWLIPWFRLRDLPTASLRNWHSSQAARVGFVSL